MWFSPDLFERKTKNDSKKVSKAVVLLRTNNMAGELVCAAVFVGPILRRTLAVNRHCIIGDNRGVEVVHVDWMPLFRLRKHHRVVMSKGDRVDVHLLLRVCVCVCVLVRTHGARNCNQMYASSSFQ